MFYRLFLNRRIGIVIGVEFIDSVCDELLVDLIGNIEFSCFIRKGAIEEFFLRHIDFLNGIT